MLWSPFRLSLLLAQCSLMASQTKYRLWPSVEARARFFGSIGIPKPPHAMAVLPVPGRPPKTISIGFSVVNLNKLGGDGEGPHLAGGSCQYGSHDSEPSKTKACPADNLPSPVRVGQVKLKS